MERGREGREGKKDESRKEMRRKGTRPEREKREKVSRSERESLRGTRKLGVGQRGVDAGCLFFLPGLPMWVFYSTL